MNFMYDWKDTKKLYWKEDFPYSGNLKLSENTNRAVSSKYTSKPKFSKRALIEKMLEEDKE